MKRVRLKISTLTLQVSSDQIDIRTRLFLIPQAWRFVVFGRITGVTGVGRSGPGGKSGAHKVYNFFIGAAALSMHVCISTYHTAGALGRKKEHGAENSFDGVEQYIGARQEDTLD